MKYALEMKVFNKRLANEIRSAKARAKAQHELAMSALEHFSVHSDATQMTKLYTGLNGTSVQVESLKAWFIKYAPVQWSNKTDQFKKDKKRAEDFVYDFDAAFVSPFYLDKDTKQQEAKTFTLNDLIKMIETFIKREEKARDEGRSQISASEIVSLEEYKAKLLRKMAANMDVERVPSEMTEDQAKAATPAPDVHLATTRKNVMDKINRTAA